MAARNLEEWEATVVLHRLESLDPDGVEFDRRPAGLKAAVAACVGSEQIENSLLRLDSATWTRDAGCGDGRQLADGTDTEVLMICRLAKGTGTRAESRLEPSP